MKQNRELKIDPCKHGATKSWTRLSEFNFTFTFHFSLSCIGEGNGNPLQCSCLESPRDGGAWWAAVYGITLSWTCLKRLSSSRSKHGQLIFDKEAKAIQLRKDNIFNSAGATGHSYSKKVN